MFAYRYGNRKTGIKIVERLDAETGFINSPT